MVQVIYCKLADIAFDGHQVAEATVWLSQQAQAAAN
jgi:hypothetical protein